MRDLQGSPPCETVWTVDPLRRLVFAPAFYISWYGCRPPQKKGPFRMKWAAVTTPFPFRPQAAQPACPLFSKGEALWLCVPAFRPVCLFRGSKLRQRLTENLPLSRNAITVLTPLPRASSAQSSGPGLMRPRSLFKRKKRLLFRFVPQRSHHPQKANPSRIGVL